MSEEIKKFEAWGIVELFGHSRVAGRISEATIGGCSFVRVDVPATGNLPAYTKFLGNGAIYAINITDELAAKMAASTTADEPLSAWTVQHLLPAGQE